MERKEEVLSAMSATKFVPLSTITIPLGIQWHQAKLIIAELVQEKKVESKEFGRRTKYRRTPLEAAPEAISSPVGETSSIPMELMGG